MQKLIFHAFSEDPLLYRRWYELKRLAEAGNDALMFELISLDLARPEGRAKTQEHPQYFSERIEEEDPVPLSIIRALAEHFAQIGESRGFQNARPQSALIAPGDLPMKYGLQFNLFGIEELAQVSPSRATAGLKQGDLVEHDGATMVVFQIDHPSGRIHLISPRLVDPTC